MVSCSRTFATLAVAVAASVLLTAQTQVPAWPREPETPAARKPSTPFTSVVSLIGEYETAAPAGGAARHLILFEQDGKPWVTIDRGEPRPFDGSTVGTSVVVAGVMYFRQQVGPEAGGQLRVTPLRDVPSVLQESLTVSPPKETGDFTPADLVELASRDATIKLDIRYATTNNFLGAVFYAQARAFLQRPAAEAVLRVQQALRPLGYGLLVHDGHRPWYVPRRVWWLPPAEKKWLVANPASGSKHNRGAAVDLTLYDLKTGAVIDMPSTYDESTPRAYAFYPGGSSLQRWHRALLRRTMEAEGFTVNPEEWWHFDYKDWKSYAIGNTPFEQIR